VSIQVLPKYDLQALTNSMMAFADGSADQILHIWSVVRLLSQGHPLSPGRIAAELQLVPDEVAALLRMGELDQDGNLVGLGLSLVPTPHAYAINDRQLYAWCAGDAIMFSIFLKSDAIIESPDPISGGMVRLIATPAGVRDVEPRTAVVSHPSAGVGLETVREQFCNVTHFFTSVETASQYVSQHPGLVIVPVDEVFRLWNRVWDREPYTSLIADR
jgi:alkylmercury lyase